ncbi:MAG: carbohydrate kinase family protein [Armatimonadota bacterium]
MSIVVTGSIAFDHIMDFPGHFKDHILPEKVHMLNVSFLVNSLKKLRGGCACNIAYNLSLIGEHSAIMGTAGTDFGPYKEWLESYGIDTRAIEIVEDEYTATCFVTTDLSDNQITGFYPGAMQYAHILNFKDLKHKDIKLAVISPNDPLAMCKYVRQCKELKIPYIYDPAHQIPRLSKEELLEGIDGAKCTILNDYEMQMILNKTGISEEEVPDLTDVLIITKGAEGSVIKDKTRSVDIPSAKANEVLDPTGAGDAYRAGIVKGLLNGYSYEYMGRLASVVAVYAVEKHGTTEHYFKKEEFEKRFCENFPEYKKELSLT